MNTQDLLGRIEPLLSRVNKPIQYVGGEHNSIVKEWQDVDVRWVLMYPDAYEVGQPNQGVAILYEVLNERDWILAERTYSVWPDMEKQMRAAGIPQFYSRRSPASSRFRHHVGLPVYGVGLHQHAQRY